MHAQHITDQQLKEIETNTPYDTIIFGVMSPEQCYLGAGAEAGAGATIFRSSRFGSESRSDFLKIYIFFIFFNF